MTRARQEGEWGGQSRLYPQAEAMAIAHCRDNGIPEAVLKDLVRFFTLDF